MAQNLAFYTKSLIVFINSHPWIILLNCNSRPNETQVPEDRKKSC